MYLCVRKDGSASVAEILVDGEKGIDYGFGPTKQGAYYASIEWSGSGNVPSNESLKDCQFFELVPVEAEIKTVTKQVKEIV